MCVSGKLYATCTDDIFFPFQYENVVELMSTNNKNSIIIIIITITITEKKGNENRILMSTLKKIKRLKKSHRQAFKRTTKTSN